MKHIGLFGKYGKYEDSFSMTVTGTTFGSSVMPKPSNGYAKLVLMAENLDDSTSVTVTVKYRYKYGVGKGPYNTISSTFTSNGTIKEYNLYELSGWGQGLFDGIEFQFNFSPSKKMKITGNYYYD